VSPVPFRPIINAAIVAFLLIAAVIRSDTPRLFLDASQLPVDARRRTQGRILLRALLSSLEIEIGLKRFAR
jgi:hypothetical protein